MAFIIIVIDLIAALDAFLLFLLVHLLDVTVREQVLVKVSSDLCLVYFWHNSDSFDFFFTFCHEDIILATTFKLRRPRAIAHSVGEILTLS